MPPRIHGGARSVLGLGEDGTVSGPEWTALRRADQPLDDQTTCSDLCFWRKKNRDATDGKPWSSDERRLLSMVRLGYQHDLRGPCMLKQLGLFSRTCCEVRMTPEKHCKRYIC